MADALVSILLEKLRAIFLDGIEVEVSPIVGVKKEVNSLTETLTTIQSVLQDADDNQVKNKAMKFFLEEFKDISYDAEDTLDEWSTRSFLNNVQHLDRNASIIKKVRFHLSSLFSCLKPIVIRHDIGNRIRVLNKRLVGAVKIKQLYDLREVKDDVNEFLAFTVLYCALPSYLKPCLMYFAVFPKGAIFEKKEIIKLWMAQGYLGSDDDKSVDLEMKGRDYFEHVSMLSFLQIIEKDNKGNIIICQMHNRVHDFVQFISKIETIVFETEPSYSNIKVRHLCAQDLNWSSIYKNKKLRTLRSFSTSTNWKRNGTLTLDLLHQLRCLRVLSLRGYQFKELPSDVEKLLQLRYLDLSDNSMLEILPETLCKLPNLQTLVLKRCKFLTRLPESIGNLSNLRHLEVDGFEYQPYFTNWGLHYFPQGIGRLSCLRTLNIFIVGVINAKKNKEGCMLGELKLLNLLEGYLKISRLGQVTNVDNATQAELKMKEKLVSLVLDFGWKQEKKEKVKRLEKILDALRPHINLKKLVIKYYQGSRLPSWISSLSNLTRLTLMDFPQCLQLPSLGKLASLEFLHLHGLLSVKSIGGEFYGADDNVNRQVIFPKLKMLKLSSLPNLEELDLAFRKGVDFFPNLRELIITDFFLNLHKLRIGWLPKLQTLPGLGKLNSLETLELSGMDGLKHSFCKFMEIPMTTEEEKKEEKEEEENEEVEGGERGRGEFPALTNLCLVGMKEWEEASGYYNNCVTMMPHLSKLSINDCPKLKVIPFYMFSQALRELTIQICPQLTAFQPWFPPLLEKLNLGGDVGELSYSLLLLLRDNCPNLNYFEISDSSQSSLPQGFNLLTSIQQLVFHNCELLDFKEDDLKHLTMLKQLEISNCAILAGRFSKGDISSSSSPSYKIITKPDQRELTKIEENSHSDLDKSYQEDVNVHSGIFCDNSEMYPIDVMRKTPEVLICYNIPSKHPDPANQI